MRISERQWASEEGPIRKCISSMLFPLEKKEKSHCSWYLRSNKRWRSGDLQTVVFVLTRGGGDSKTFCFVSLKWTWHETALLLHPETSLHLFWWKSLLCVPYSALVCPAWNLKGLLAWIFRSRCFSDCTSPSNGRFSVWFLLLGSGSVWVVASLQKRRAKCEVAR